MSEQAKLNRVSCGGQVIMGCDDEGEGLHLRVSRCENMIAVEIRKNGRKYKAAVFTAPEDWSGNMMRNMAFGIFNGLRSWSGRGQRKRAHKKARAAIVLPVALAKGLLLGCKQTIEHDTTQVKGE